jgi:hypothetical protein
MNDPLLAQFRAAAEGWRPAVLAREPELAQFSDTAISNWLSGRTTRLSHGAEQAVRLWLTRQARNDEAPPTGGGDLYARGLLDAAALMSETVAQIIRRAQAPVAPHDAHQLGTRAREALASQPAAPKGRRARG